MDFLVLIGQVVLIQKDQPPDIVCLLDQIMFRGMPRSNPLFLVQVKKSSTVPWIATSELTLISSLLHDIDFFLDVPLVLFGVNLSVLYLTTNPVFHA